MTICGPRCAGSASRTPWSGSREHLWDFVYRSAHLDFLRRRREWFQHLDEPHLVLWWVPAGHIPALDEAIARLDRLRRDGPTPDAFTFHQPFDAPLAVH
jgi:Domain of unknown function (DUF3291)